MPKIDVLVQAARPSHFDESAIGYGTVSLREVPVYRETEFSKAFRRTEERAEIDALLIVLATLRVEPKKITHENGALTVAAADGKTIGVSVKTILSNDDHMNRRMGDIDAGLREWSAAGGAPALKGKQVIVSFPSLREADPMTVFAEIKKVASSPQIAAQPTDKYLMVPAAFPALRALEAKIIIKQSAGGAATVRLLRSNSGDQVPDAGLDMLALMMATSRSIREAAGNPDEAWLIVWFPSLHNAFSLESTRRQIEMRQNFPFDKVIVTDGIQFGAITVTGD
jgi:hypothetical protein